jgi:4-hydroxybenzoate polyprenyltransferase
LSGEVDREKCVDADVGDTAFDHDRCDVGPPISSGPVDDRSCGTGRNGNDAFPVVELAQSIRVGEALLMMGFPVAGAAYGLQGPQSGELIRAALALASMAPLSISVYAWNAVAGLETDGRDPKFRDDPRFGGGATARRLRHVGWGGLALGGAVGAALGPWFAVTIIALWALWYLYSRPGGLKAIPGGGAAAHIVGGATMFLAPYLLVRPADPRGLWLATAFCLAFAAGHAHHEIADRVSDRGARLRTGAVTWGPRRAFQLGLVMAVGAYAAVAAAWWTGALSMLEAVPYAVAAPIHLGCGLAGSRVRDLDAANRRYQHLYRLVFGGAVGASLVVGLLT